MTVPGEPSRDIRERLQRIHALAIGWQWNYSEQAEALARIATLESQLEIANHTIGLNIHERGRLRAAEDDEAVLGDHNLIPSLKAENASLRSQLSADTARRIELELERDAMRYRYARERQYGGYMSEIRLTPELFDGACDLGMSQHFGDYRDAFIPIDAFLRERGDTPRRET